MKKQSKSLFTQLSIKQVETLTTVVEETIDYSYVVHNNKTFTAADLWNIQRQQKSRIQRRFSF